MSANIFAPGEFYNYPLILKKLLKTPLIYAPEKEIVSSDQRRYTYTDLNQRIHRLAAGLKSVGVRPGDVVAVLDYDTSRYLKCFFAIPMMGAKQVYPGPYEPERILRLIETEGVTFSHCVPTIMQMILTCPMAKSMDLSRWKVVMGGAQLPKGLAQEAMNMGINIHAGYGMSETGPVMTIATPNESMLDWRGDRLLNVITKTGKPLPLAEIEVVDAQVNKLPHDGQTTGEVVMRSPWLTQSYFKSDDKTKALWKKGWLHSGDVGHVDAHGYLQITDRIKDVIKTGGEWVSSLDLESILSQHPAVLESAAIGIPDEKWGERPMMIVTLKPDFAEHPSAFELKAYMLEAAKQGKLPKYGVPDHYEFVDSIDKTSVGKLDKKVLRKKYSNMP